MKCALAGDLADFLEDYPAGRLHEGRNQLQAHFFGRFGRRPGCLIDCDLSQHCSRPPAGQARLLSFRED
jgi:hypothetical protein